MNGIDSVYEFAGFRLARALQELFQGAGLPLLVALAGTAWLVHQVASDRVPVRELAVHVLALGLLLWLVGTPRGGPAPAPRLVAWLNRGADLLQKRAVSRINEKFLDAPFEWERLAALASFAHVHDIALAQDVSRFLESCAKPALARSGPAEANLLRPGVLSYSARCERGRAALWGRLEAHVDRHPLHRSALQLSQKHDPSGAPAFRSAYLDEVVRRAVDEPGSPVSESALVAASLGEYSLMDPAQSTGGVPGWARGLLGVWSLAPDGMQDRALDAVIGGSAALQQSWENRFTAKQSYFLAVAYAPHLYGLMLLFVIGLFPVAALFALAPGKWRALLNYGKVFVSIKLWPVCWAALSTFNAKRGALEALAPGERGASDVFLAVASMYLLTPALVFLIVHLAATAAALPFSAAVPPPAGPGLGPVGPVLSVAARLK